jgi:DNA-binding transcriptional ArsR family regulator
MSHDDSSSPRRLDRALAVSVAETMQALSAPSRLLILDCLRDGPLPVAELAAVVGMEQSAVSHQLRVLRHLGLVTGERRGKQVIYALHDPHVGELLDEAVGHVAHLRRAGRTAQVLIEVS